MCQTQFELTQICLQNQQKRMLEIRFFFIKIFKKLNFLFELINVLKERNKINSFVLFMRLHTVCPRSLAYFYIAAHHIKEQTARTYSTIRFFILSIPYTCLKYINYVVIFCDNCFSRAICISLNIQ